MSSTRSSRGTSSPFPDHYEQTRIDGKEHPADVVINDLPVIIRFKRRLSKLSEELRQSVRDPKLFMAYVDARGLYQSTRENLFFNAGFEHGLLAARQDCLAERIMPRQETKGRRAFPLSPCERLRRCKPIVLECNPALHLPLRMRPRDSAAHSWRSKNRCPQFLSAVGRSLSAALEAKTDLSGWREISVRLHSLGRSVSMRDFCRHELPKERCTSACLSFIFGNARA